MRWESAPATRLTVDKDCYALEASNYYAYGTIRDVKSALLSGDEKRFDITDKIADGSQRAPRVSRLPTPSPVS